MEEEFKRDAVIHHLMAVCGGFIGVYAIVSRMGVFGSAQSANLIELVCDILGREPMEILSRVAALAIYMGAMVLYVVLEKRSPWDVRRVSIFIDLGAVGLSGLIPEGVNPFTALYPIFFATSFQWCAFKGAGSYVSATIFSTNNLKQTVTSVTEALLSRKDEPEYDKKMEKAKFFGGTLACFHLGVAAGYGLWLLWGVRSIWACALPLCACGLLVRGRREAQASVRGTALPGKWMFLRGSEGQ